MSHKEKILKLRSQGLSYRQIEKELGCSKGTIAYHLGDNQKQKNLMRGNINKAKRRRIMWEYKEKNGCTDCKEMYPHYVLEFDHKPEFEKVGSPTEIAYQYGIEAALKEAEKCDVVCANCHKIRTHNRNQFGIVKIPTC
jgi:NAD-dependent dihydropyrimidine dehydrogenase PreA subunit